MNIFVVARPDGFATFAWSMLPVASALLVRSAQIPSNVRVTWLNS